MKGNIKIKNKIKDKPVTEGSCSGAALEQAQPSAEQQILVLGGFLTLGSAVGSGGTYHELATLVGCTDVPGWGQSNHGHPHASKRPPAGVLEQSGQMECVVSGRVWRGQFAWYFAQEGVQGGRLFEGGAFAGQVGDLKCT